MISRNARRIHNGTFVCHRLRVVCALLHITYVYSEQLRGGGTRREDPPAVMCASCHRGHALPPYRVDRKSVV